MTNQHTCTRVFSPSWPDAQNVSIPIPAPYWKTGLKAVLWSLYLLQWHGVEIRVKDIPEFPSVAKPPPMERDARVFSFLHRPLFPCSSSLGRGSFSTTVFRSQRDCRVCIPGKQFLNHRVEPDTRSGEEPSLCREQVGTEEAELPSI